MSNFDPVTFSAVGKLKSPVGSLMLVPEGFSSSQYLDTGTSFSAAAYPELAAAFPNSNSNDIVVNSYTLPDNPSSYDATASAIGTIVGIYSINGTPDTHYIIFSTGKVYVSAAGATPVFYKQITTPLGANANLQLNFVNPTVVNNRIYCGGSGTSTAYSATFPETYFIDLTQDFATVAITVPRATFSWRCVFTRYRQSTGTYIALGYPAGSGTTMAVCSSSDGITFTQIATGVAVNASALNGIAGNDTTWVLATASTVVFTSADGITWTSRTTTAAFTSIAYSTGNALFVASPATVGAALQTSPDGITWTTRAQTAPICTTAIVKIMTNGSDVIAVATSGQTQYSSNGTTFAGRNIPTILNNGSLFYTSYSASADNYLVYIGTQYASTNCHYQTQKMTTANYANATDLTNTKFISFSNAASNSYSAPVFLSDNLIGCTIEQTSTISGLSSIAGQYTATGGSTWIPFNIKFEKIAYFYGPFISATIVATDTKFYIITMTAGTASSPIQILSSPDGANWTLSAVYANSNQLYGFVAFKNKLYIMTQGGVYVSADDGNTWSSVPGVGYSTGNILFKTNYVVGMVNITGYTYVSTDGATWRMVSSLSQMTGVTQGAVTANADRVIVQNATNYTQLYVLKEEDLVSSTYTTPSHRGGFLSVGNTVLMFNSGYAMVSDNLNSWKTVKVGDGAKLTNGNGGNWGTVGNALYKLTLDTSNKQTPKVISNVPNAKWVVRAKK